VTFLAALLFIALVAIGAGIPLGHAHRPWRTP
jgi:hypothetical protein